MRLLSWAKTLLAPPPILHPDAQDIDMSEFLDSLGDVVMMLDHHLHLVRVNRSWQNITGKSVSQSLDQPFTDFLHPEDQATWDRALQNLATNPSPESGELLWLRLIGEDTDICWCEMRVQPVRPDSLYPLSATLCDITPQVRNEQARNASHRSLDSLVSRLPAMIYRGRNNTTWTMEYVSQGCEELTGYSAENLVNQALISYGSLIHEQDAAYVWDRVQIALQQHQAFELKYRIIHESGNVVNVMEKGKGIYTDSGEVLGVEGIILTLDDVME